MKLKLLVVLSIAFGLVVRLYLVYTLPKWIDETFTYNILSKPFGLITSGLLDPGHPPGYYLFLKLWFLVDNSLFWLRLSTIFLFLLNCYLLYKIGIIFVNRRFSLFLLISYALSGYSVIYDWQIRPYTGLSTLILGSLYLLTIYPTKKVLFTFFLMNSLGLFFDYGFIWYIGSLFIFLLYNLLLSIWKRKDDEAPRPDSRGIFSLLLRRKRNPAEAENSSHSFLRLHPGFSAKRDKRLLSYILPTAASLSLFLLFWFPFAKDNFLSSSELLSWVSFFTNPSFFIPFFLGAAHRVQIFIVFMITLFAFGCSYYNYSINGKNLLIHYLLISSMFILFFTYVVSTLFTPILHVRNLHIVGISVIFIYALGFYWVSRKKLLSLIVWGLYLLNFFLIVNSIFTAPGRLLIKF